MAELARPYIDAERPHYVAFVAYKTRIPVIASVTTRDADGRTFGTWYSERTPEGQAQEIPSTYVIDIQDDDYARDLIGLIEIGKQLPGELLATLPDLRYGDDAKTC